MSDAVPGVNNPPQTEGIEPKDTILWENILHDKVFVPGLERLRSMIQLLQRQAHTHKQVLAHHGALANEAEMMANLVDAAIAEIDTKAEKGGTAEVDKDLKEYKKKNTGIYEGELPGELNKANYLILRANIKKYAVQNSEEVTRGQTHAQRLMATYNVNISICNELQTKCTELFKMMAQAIRG